MKMKTFFNIAMILIVALCSASVTNAQTEEQPSRYHKAETLSVEGQQINLKSAEVEKLEHHSLLTVAMTNRSDHLVREIELLLTIYDESGTVKYAEKWRKRIDLFAGNEAEMDISLDKGVSLEGRIVLELIGAQ